MSNLVHSTIFEPGQFLGRWAYVANEKPTQATQAYAAAVSVGTDNRTRVVFTTPKGDGFQHGVFSDFAEGCAVADAMARTQGAPVV